MAAFLRELFVIGPWKVTGTKPRVLQSRPCAAFCAVGHLSFGDNEKKSPTRLRRAIIRWAKHLNAKIIGSKNDKQLVKRESHERELVREKMEGVAIQV
jgi:hypothetical protein